MPGPAKRNATLVKEAQKRARHRRLRDLRAQGVEDFAVLASLIQDVWPGATKRMVIGALAGKNSRAYESRK